MKRIFTHKIVVAILSFVMVMVFSNSCKKDKESTVTDVDGNVYNTVEIGSQLWMAENLKTTKFNDGTEIPFIVDNSAWTALSTPGYSWYNNQVSNKSLYGGLYNWFAVSSGKLCPTGWRVPSDSEWDILQSELGGELEAGGKMKEVGTTYWNTPNTGATNESGFNGRGGGLRYLSGGFGDFKSYGLWWTSTAGPGGAWFKSLYHNNKNLNTQAYDPKNGLSVRCIKNE